MSSESLGHALRAIGRGPVEVILRVQDMAMRSDPVRGIGGVGQECIGFTANDFRAVAGCDDVWQFDVVEAVLDTDTVGAGMASAGPPQRKLRRLAVFARGDDLLLVRSESKLAAV